MLNQHILSGSGLSALSRQTQEALLELLDAHKVFLIEAVIRGTEGRRVVELFIDSPEGITLELCSTLSKAVGDVLDAHHAFRGSYRLDVSSPGVDRPLQYAWQYARNRGRVVVLELNDGTSTTGRIGDVDEKFFALEPLVSNKRPHGKSRSVQSSASEARCIAFTDVRRAVVQVMIT
jgi:ribosome maturation factor RimP